MNVAFPRSSVVEPVIYIKSTLYDYEFLDQEEDLSFLHFLQAGGAMMNYGAY